MPLVERCPTCGRRVTRKRVCIECGTPILRHHKFVQTESGPKHRNCANPSYYSGGKEDVDEITVTIQHCARCQGTHERMKFIQFKRAVYQQEDGVCRYTHWAMCPTTNEPILMRVLDNPE